MGDFDPDEIFFLLIAGAGTLVGSIRYYRTVLAIPKFRRAFWSRFVLAITPPICMAITLGVLLKWSDPSVSQDAGYVVLFLLGSGLSLTIGCAAMSIVGLSVRENVLADANPAAFIVAVSAMLAITLIYAGSNIGSGPTIWTTLVPAAIGLTSLLLVLLVMHFTGGGMLEAVLVDRDMASALRLGGALIGCGLVFGRAAAGRWTDWNNTFNDFLVFSLPALALAIAAAFFHRTMRPTPQMPQPPVTSKGLTPAALLIGLGLVVVALEPHGFHPSRW